MHLQCFGLGAYLESNMKMRALNNRWTCPVCGNLLKPRDLRIDGFVERVLTETPGYIEEVLIMQDGSYRCIEELPEKASTDQAALTLKAADATDTKIVEASEVTELPTEIDDTQRFEAEGNKRKHLIPGSVPPMLTRRQRRRQKLLTVGNEDEKDSD